MLNKFVNKDMFCNILLTCPMLPDFPLHQIYSNILYWHSEITFSDDTVLTSNFPFICCICSMLRIQRKIYDGLNLLEFFATREWIFKSENYLALNNYLTEADKKIFPISEYHKYPLKEYLISGLLGTRQYCLKEDLSSLPRCRQKQKV